MLLITFSPAAMLLYERGNVDLLIFFICAMAILMIEYSSLAAAVIILLGALLKIFPIFALVIFFEKKWKLLWKNVLFVITSFAIYSWITFSNIQASWNLTMRGKSISYGVNILFTRYHNSFLAMLKKISPVFDYDSLLAILPHLVGLAVLVAVLVISLRTHSIPSSRNSRNLAAFRMGAFIYIGTFLLGNNWDYRLTFLLFTIPQLTDWIYTEKGKHRFLVLLTISLIIISCWHFIFVKWFSLIISNPEVAIIFDEVANWSLFAVLAYLSFISLPQWVKEIVRNPIKGFRLASLRESGTNFLELVE
ncbi:MAG: DUF2029 domain-containing protein [Anaerolineae bacterium]|jgi:hypothetical protein|nr:DUF2029 domain-containing protein [Anaerolineae bacterium]